MRRRSIIGPLILISIGLLILANNLYPELPLFDLLSTYWPFILIAWGGLRLVEVLFWAATSRPVPMAGVSGGEWTLIVFLCLFGSGLFFIRHRASNWPRVNITSRGLEVFGEAFDYPVSAQHATGKSAKVIVENWRGNARITGADVNEVKVTGRKTIRAYHQNEADLANKQTPVDIEVSGDLVTVRTNQDRLDGSRRASNDLEITVPRGASIECRGRYGDFDITDVAGNVDINSDNAGVRLQNIGGGARIDLRRSDIVRAVNVKGNIELKGRGQDIELETVEGQVSVNGSFSGELRFRALSKPLRFESSQTELRVEKLPGTIRMALGNITGDNLVGPIFLNTKSRDVELKDFTQALDIQLERGDVELRPSRMGMGKIDVRTRSGDIDLAIPAGGKFELRASTRRGDVNNEYGPPLAADPEERGGTLRGSVGQGQGPSISINTEHGTITVRRATEAEKIEKPLKAEKDIVEEMPKGPKPPAPPSAKPPVVPPKAIE